MLSVVRGGSISSIKTGTLFIQRRIYLRRRVAHLQDESRAAAGLPLGRSRRVGSATYKSPDSA